MFLESVANLLRFLALAFVGHMFQPQAIYSALSTTARNRYAVVKVISHCRSTNDTLKNWARNISCRPGRAYALICHHQSHGRGQFNRTWQSNKGLSFSVLWPLQTARSKLETLPLVVGVSLCQALHALGYGAHLQLKWPNDLVAQPSSAPGTWKKLGGILVETVVSRHVVWGILGIGLNLFADPNMTQQLPAYLALQQLPPTLPSPANIIATILNYLPSSLEHFEQFGFEPFVPQWNALNIWKNQTICIEHPYHAPVQGLVLGVDLQGRLLLQTPHGLVAQPHHPDLKIEIPLSTANYDCSPLHPKH